jgi:hypothetical protein
LPNALWPGIITSRPALQSTSKQPGINGSTPRGNAAGRLYLSRRSTRFILRPTATASTSRRCGDRRPRCCSRLGRPPKSPASCSRHFRPTSWSPIRPIPWSITRGTKGQNELSRSRLDSRAAGSFQLLVLHRPDRSADRNRNRVTHDAPRIARTGRVDLGYVRLSWSSFGRHDNMEKTSYSVGAVVGTRHYNRGYREPGSTSGSVPRGNVGESVCGWQPAVRGLAGSAGDGRRRG